MSTISEGCDTTNYLKTILVLIMLLFPFTGEAGLSFPISQNSPAVSGTLQCSYIV